jgi:hypothetical protein
LPSANTALKQQSLTVVWYEAEDSRTLEAIWGNISVYNSQVSDGSFSSESDRDQNECDKGRQTTEDKHINS